MRASSLTLLNSALSQTVGKSVLLKYVQNTLKSFDQSSLFLVNIKTKNNYLQMYDEHPVGHILRR